MSCSDILSMPPVSCKPMKPSQEDLRRAYELPNTAIDISVAYTPPRPIRMPFGMLMEPAKTLLRYRIGRQEHSRDL